MELIVGLLKCITVIEVKDLQLYAYYYLSTTRQWAGFVEISDNTTINFFPYFWDSRIDEAQIKKRSAVQTGCSSGESREFRYLLKI